ncbi:MAG: DinB family protein [Mycobacterium sp.]|nr:DinB family protein [Mycobacterium sp.]
MSWCEECGYTYDLAVADRFGAEIPREVGELARIAAGVERTRLVRRTDPAQWSPLEYACHVRDVLLVQRERVLLARRVEAPEAVPMGRDERAGYDGYIEADPQEVAEELMVAARLFANTLGRLDIADWERTLVYGWPERTERTLRWLAAHTQHEVRHHLLDVRRQLE